MTVVKTCFPFVLISYFIIECPLRTLNGLWFISSRHLAILIFGDWLPQVNGFVESSTVYCRGSQMCQHRDDVDNSNLFYPKLIQYPHWLVFVGTPAFFRMGFGETASLATKKAVYHKLECGGLLELRAWSLGLGVRRPVNT